APPGTQPPRRFRPRLHWELVLCASRGHELVGTDAAQLSDVDAIFAREDAWGTRWYRCLRCDSWLALPAPAAPTRPAPPARHELDNLFTTSSAHLHLLGAALLVYAAVEGVEAAGLWYQQRWAEYLTFLVTSSLLPLEVYEIANRASALKILAFVVNVVIVIYL